MTGNDHLDDLAREVMADVLVGIVTDRLSVPQAVQAIDDFVDSLKGKVSDEARMETKATLLEYVFSLREIKEEQRRESQDERMAEEAVAQGYGLVPGSWREGPETKQDWGQRTWDSIKAHLPEDMYCDPETERKNAWRIGFLLGYGGERLGANC